MLTRRLSRSRISAPRSRPERYHGGLLQRRSASMHMGKFGAGLAHAAARAGAPIHQNAAVTAIDRIAHGRFRLKTADATIEADQVLLATGASQQGPFGWFRRRIMPVGSFIIVTEPLGAERAAAIMPRPPHLHQHAAYWQLLPLERGQPSHLRRTGALCDVEPEIGLEERRYPDRPNARSFSAARRYPDRLLLGRPGRHDAGPAAARREQDGMHYAMGYSGHGVQMSTYMGHVMARRIAGEDAPIPGAPSIGRRSRSISASPGFCLSPGPITACSTGFPEARKIVLLLRL